MLTAPASGSDAAARISVAQSILLLHEAAALSEAAATAIASALKGVAPVKREVFGEGVQPRAFLERLGSARLCVVVVSDAPAFWDALPEIASSAPVEALVFVFSEQRFDYERLQANGQELFRCVLLPMMWNKKNRGPVQGAISFHDGIAEPHPVSPVDWKIAGTLTGRRNLNLARLLLLPALVRNGFQAATGKRPRLGLYGSLLFAPVAVLAAAVVFFAVRLHSLPPAQIRVFHYREQEAEILKSHPTARVEANHLTETQLLQLSNLQSRMFSAFDDLSCITFLTGEPKYQDYALRKLPVELVDQYFELRVRALEQPVRREGPTQDAVDRAFEHEFLVMPDEQSRLIFQITQKEEKDRTAADLCLMRRAYATNANALPEQERIAIARTIGF